MTFGICENEYKVSKLQQLVNEGEIDRAKRYVLKYFCRLAVPASTILYWSPSQKTKKMITYREMKETFLPNLTHGDMKTGIFKLRDWFFGGDTELYYLQVDPRKPAMYEKKGATYINMFGGFLHSEPKPFKQYPMKIKENVKYIWKHIKMSWCSGIQESYQYNKNWIINMVAGRKMRTCLYNKGNQGVGKSIVTDFLSEKVLGESIAYRCPSIEPLTGNDNSMMRGKVLFVFEEPPAVSASSWMAMSNSLKHLITSPTFELHEKYKSSYECNNFCSFVMNTNNNAVKISVDDRRMVCNDLSTQFQGNRQYFQDLAKRMTLETGEAFYAYCMENKDESFDETDIPTTTAKTDLINEGLPDVLQYIKDTYILDEEAKTENNEEFKEFYAGYKSSLKDRRAKSKIEVSKILKANNIGLTKGRANKLFFRISKQELIDIFTKKKWIHETDEFDGNNEDDEPKDEKPKKKKQKEVKNLFIDEEPQPQPDTTEKDEEIEKLKKQLKKLRDQNNYLRKQQGIKKEMGLKETPEDNIINEVEEDDSTNIDMAL